MAYDEKKLRAEREAQCETKAPENMASIGGELKEVPPKEVLLNWIEEAERRLIENLTELRAAKDMVRYAPDSACRIVKALLRDRSAIYGI